MRFVFSVKLSCNGGIIVFVAKKESLAESCIKEGGDQEWVQFQTDLQTFSRLSRTERLWVDRLKLWIC